MDDRIASSPSGAEDDAGKDWSLFMRRAEGSLQDPRVRGYFINGLVSDKDVLDRFTEGRAFDQARRTESYLRYSKFRERVVRTGGQRGGVVYLLRGGPIRASRLQDLRDRWLADMVESIIYPNVVEAINKVLLRKDYRRLQVEPESQGLKKLQDPLFRVPTRSLDRLRQLLTQMDGGSIALAGPRGAGKSTLLKVFSQLSGDQMIGVQGICVYVPAPAEYVAKEFIADLFQRLCEAYLQYRGSTAATRLPGAASPGVRRGGKFRRMIALSWLTIRALLAMVLAVWVAALLVGKAFPERSRNFATLARWINHVQMVTHIRWPDDRWYFEVLIVLVVLLIALACWPRPRLWRRYIRRPEEQELTRRARDYLLRLQVDKTVTKSASIAGPIIRGMAFGLNRGTSVKYIPWTMPELVGQARRFIEDVSAELRILNRSILIGIDEIDRIGSLEQAERFIGEIKAIFGIEGCFFMVAVAEDVGSMFAQRATAGRTIVENAFDEIVTVRPLDLTEARSLLLRRVPGFTDAFVYLVHAMSGGLPRELIRMSRRLVEVHLKWTAAGQNPGHLAATRRRPMHGPPANSQLGDLAPALVQEAVIEALEAARDQMSYLLLGSAWAHVFDELRLASAALRRDDYPRGAAYLVIKKISRMQANVPHSGTSEDEDIACRILDRLSAFAYFGITVMDAFSDRYFNLDRAKIAADYQLRGSYEELAAARSELTVSAASSRMMLDRFRQSLGCDSAKWRRSRLPKYSRSQISQDSRPGGRGEAISAASDEAKNTWGRNSDKTGMRYAMTYGRTPTFPLGPPGTKRRLVSTWLEPAGRRARWYRDWPPGLEWKITPLRRHLAVLLGPIFLAIFGLAAAAALSIIDVRGNGLLMDLIWLASFVLFVRLIWKILGWSAGHFFVASDRVVVVSGILRRRINAIWLAQITAIELRRSVLGLIFGYGELVFHSQSPDAVMVAFDYMPYPYELFLELCELAFPKPKTDLDILTS
jgi:energy-coupling factor transporter ATP-binding protein EcfA2